MRFTLWLAAAFVAVLGFATPGHAQATRTWVSGVGDDANPCSRTAPCKTFAGAISKTAAAGEINCLDPAGYGALTITKSISVVCSGTLGSVLVSGTNGFIVNAAATDVVVIQGVEFEGLNTGLNGISVVSGTKVLIHDVSIRHFTQNGINVSGTSGRVTVSDSYIINNAGGFNVGAGNTGLSFRTFYDNNPSFALQVASGSNLIISGNKLQGSGTGIAGAGNIVSFGDNAIGGTGTAATVIPLR